MVDILESVGGVLPCRHYCRMLPVLVLPVYQCPSGYRVHQSNQSFGLQCYSGYGIYGIYGSYGIYWIYGVAVVGVKESSAVAVAVAVPVVSCPVLSCHVSCVLHPVVSVVSIGSRSSYVSSSGTSRSSSVPVQLQLQLQSSSFQSSSSPRVLVQHRPLRCAVYGVRSTVYRVPLPACHSQSATPFHHAAVPFRSGLVLQSTTPVLGLCVLRGYRIDIQCSSASPCIGHQGITVHRPPAIPCIPIQRYLLGYLGLQVYIGLQVYEAIQCLLVLLCDYGINGIQEVQGSP